MACKRVYTLYERSRLDFTPRARFFFYIIYIASITSTYNKTVFSYNKRGCRRIRIQNATGVRQYTYSVQITSKNPEELIS